MERVKSKTRLKPIIKYFIFCVFIVALAFLSYVFINKGLNNTKTVAINYKENNSIDYNVYLKPNNFFEQSYLPKDSTYISTLIDYVDAIYNFNMTYDKNVTGSYTYFVRASLMANKSDNNTKSYLTKEYVLTDNVTAPINNQNNFSINQNIKIDYQKYNELLTEFKQEYGLTIDGKLKVELVVNSKVKYNDNGKAIEDSSSMNIVIPLTQQSVDISINTNPEVKNNNVTVSKTSINDTKHKLYLWAGISFGILSILILYILIKEVKYEESKISKYTKELGNILTTYDSIIVSVNEVKDLSNYNIIKVNSFNELLDAHNEVRMPINFIEVEKNQKSVFVLISDEVAWLYILQNDGDTHEKN